MFCLHLRHTNEILITRDHKQWQTKRANKPLSNLKIKLSVNAVRVSNASLQGQNMGDYSFQNLVIYANKLFGNLRFIGGLIS